MLIIHFVVAVCLLFYFRFFFSYISCFTFWPIFTNETFLSFIFFYSYKILGNLYFVVFKTLFCCLCENKNFLMRVLRFCYKIFIMFGMQYIKKVENFANNKHKEEKNLLERDLYAQCQALPVKIAILNIFSHHFLVLRVLWYQKSCACYRKSGLKMFLNGHCKLIKTGHLFLYYFQIGKPKKFQNNV